MTSHEGTGNKVAENVAWQLVEKLDEKRGYPRIAIGNEVTFRNAGGQHCVAQLLNLSPDGIQIRCNVATAQVLHPAGGRICPGNAPMVQADVTVPLPDGDAPVSICAELMYLTTLPEEPRCVIGLRFLELRPKAARIIDAFFAAELETIYAAEEPLAAAGA